jgi:hypothetical protein
MSNSRSLAVIAALAGALISAGAANAAPGAGETCGILAPRYQPKTRSTQSEPVRFLGGARLHRPVAAPCPKRGRPVDV